ncbi:hypothetical protein H9X96_18410 [Pedobacter sp. N36a]|uniref:hypothetical protein n=1 Tax=Pedobacter sp. N36a TaxID=2767996 RepID=UPI001656F7D2|nr:hypothetical protein [Pedobacter sp. N36a]MBC8987741.1 hypothetical protein [Pedobacter sp. N36a]
MERNKKRSINEIQSNNFSKVKAGVGGTIIVLEEELQSSVITPASRHYSKNQTNMNDIQKNNDIINTILAQRESTKLELQAQNNINKTLIDNQTWFTENVPQGIMSIDQFNFEIETSSKTQLQSLSSLLRIMSESRKINTTDFAHTDKNGKSYYWIKAFGKNGGTEFKIFDFPGLAKLIEGYIWQLYLVNVSLEGLYSEANKER